ncbi:hypothetical protein HYY71_05195 [Candidatus Woesearchaeota archaeon]|nr:hypothetical protein [Candidatus Woesearchaeota archaeon]
MVCHELSGHFILDDFEKCADERCYVYGIPRREAGGFFPPYGRDHFCENHASTMLKTAEAFKKA